MLLEPCSEGEWEHNPSSACTGCADGSTCLWNQGRAGAGRLHQGDLRREFLMGKAQHWSPECWELHPEQPRAAAGWHSALLGVRWLWPSCAPHTQGASCTSPGCGWAGHVSLSCLSSPRLAKKVLAVGRALVQQHEKQSSPTKHHLGNHIHPSVWRRSSFRLGKYASRNLHLPPLWIEMQAGDSRWRFCEKAVSNSCSQC